MPGIDVAQPGLYAPALGPHCATQTVQPAAASQARLARFVCPKAMTITRMGFVVHAIATVDDQIDMGIVSADGLTLLGSTGAKSGLLNATTGLKLVSLLAPVNLVAGQVYYAAFAHGTIGGTVAQVLCTNVPNSNAAQMFGTTMGVMELIAVNSKFPLAAPFAISAVMNTVPILALLQ